MKNTVVFMTPKCLISPLLLTSHLRGETSNEVKQFKESKYMDIYLILDQTKLGLRCKSGIEGHFKLRLESLSVDFLLE